MSYIINGVECETDEEGFLVEADFSEEAVKVIAAAEAITLSDDHWMVLNYMRDSYREEDHAPNFRTMLKQLDELHPGIDWKQKLYDLFPEQPARQAARVAGLTKPFGKGGY